ncbi:MAG TPA: inositol 2-dehydrogenase [Aggregatilineales bacterium]|nr:inositol 2-dehydrogenase [Aggregatilineales bacterium]
MTEKIRLGLVGTGRIGKVHGQTITQHIPQAELIALTDINRDSAQHAAQDFGVKRIPATFEEMVADPDLDAVIICSATNTHVPFIIAAAQHGKHIFCEKPIAPDLKQIDSALDAVEKANVKLMIGFNRRFDPNAERIKCAIDQQEIGTPHLMHIISRDPAPPPAEYVRVSGGMFMDMTIHDFDMARFLLGEVEEIYAVGGVLVDPAIGEAGDIDTALITLKFASGALGVIDNSRKAVYGYDQRIEVFGSAGSAASSNLYPDAVTISSAENVRQALPLNFFMDRYIQSYQAELTAFIRCLTENTAPPVSGLDGRIPVVMAKAALTSLRENRPVKLAEVQA